MKILFLMITFILSSCIPFPMRYITKNTYIYNPFYHQIFYNESNVSELEKNQKVLITIAFTKVSTLEIGRKLILYHKSLDCPFAVINTNSPIFYRIEKATNVIGRTRDVKIYNKTLTIIKTGLTDKNIEDITEDEKKEPKCLSMQEVISLMQ